MIFKIQTGVAVICRKL